MVDIDVYRIDENLERYGDNLIGCIKETSDDIVWVTICDKNRNAFPLKRRDYIHLCGRESNYYDGNYIVDIATGGDLYGLKKLD